MYGFVTVVSDPDEVDIIANTCLKKSFFYKFLIDVLGNGLLLSDGG